MKTTGKERRIPVENDGVAVLFDAENISPRSTSMVVEQARQYGVKPILRAYADFSRGHTKGWEQPALKYGIRTIHQFSYRSGNSSSDFLMMYDAFKLLHSGKVGIFLVVTNDGDFLTPIQLIRQSGGYVHGFADRGKVKNELVRACDTFSFIPGDSLGPMELEQEGNTIPVPVTRELVQACEQLDPSNGWISLSRLGQHARIPLRGTGYRFRNLSRLIRACGAFETDAERGHQFLRLVNGTNIEELLDQASSDA